MCGPYASTQWSAEAKKNQEKFAPFKIGALDMDHDWINHEMRLGNSEAKTKILDNIHKFKDFTIDLEQTVFEKSLENSKKIAEFVGFEFNAKVHFKYLEPFFGTPESNNYDSDALIFPHPKECRGIFTIEVEISKDGVSAKAYDNSKL